MASYSSYKRIRSDQVPDQTITTTHIADNVRDNYCVRWFYGSPGACTPGCCCLWTVPACTRRLVWELWGAGGNGAGACSCNRCQHRKGSGGGAYTTKSHETNAGCQYTVCAAGVYRCYSRECGSCNGCSSYVNGYNLSNLCACGGEGGCANGAWTDQCYSYMPYCVSAYYGCSGTAAGDGFAGWVHSGAFQGQSGYFYPGNACHCWKSLNHSTGAFGLNTGFYEQNGNYCWIRCGCWTAPYGMGGQNAMSNYCGGCCGQGGTGGGGIVKVAYY